MSESEPPNTSQRNIYNTWLRVTKTQAGRPFRYRKRWDNLSDEQLIALERLDRFFKKHRQINMDDFFKSPYVLYTDAVRSDHPEYTNFPLQFYTRYKAISMYKLTQQNNS